MGLNVWDWDFVLLTCFGLDCDWLFGFGGWYFVCVDLFV